ncbi:terminase [Thioclava dalianensis]|uniref:Terminase n=1 Tax=Thioclava dalianensis TaxID=1185766 RepID=A0A074U1H6_9RHOB|nr:terminase TerL endonuclease subunit [Thioclava dalianensis]KEP68522.1 terminase [Thioclava dalianensis]SFN84211.1 Phage terminase-like protein, large subunit, contains N-terminal HTH domain [Thioclava dalianensis]
MTRSTFPDWIYDGSEIPDPLGHGERAVKFLKMLRHPKSGKPFQLDLWQERIVRRIYGPRHENGTRVVKTVVILVPRGNRKTSLAAALEALHTVGPERVPGGEVITSASDRKQARIAYEELRGLLTAHPKIAPHIRCLDYRNRITFPKERSFCEAISADAGTQHGRTPVFVLADELHAWKKRELWDVLRSGLVKTPGSLLVVATTAGRGQENVAWEIVDDARKIARGEVDDPSILPVLFEADRDCDWQDEEVWFKVNPGLRHGYPDIEGLRQLAKEGARRIGDREAFRQLNLNIWLDHATDPFVEMPVYDEGAGTVDLADLEATQAPCWLGVDLSSNNDLTAVVAAWRDGQDGYQVHPWFFCPEETLQIRQDLAGVPYVTWSEDGHIIPTQGNVVDFRAVEDQIRELCARFNVREIAFDPHLARNMLNDLLEDGFPAVEFRQGWVSMAPAVKELERAIVGRRFRHGGHPVLRWNFANIEVRTDSAGNRAFHKGKSKDKIDGAVAAAMAVARAAADEGGLATSADWFTDDMFIA